MITCAVGKGKAADGREAARRAAASARKAFADAKAELVLVFASPQYPGEAVLAGLHDVFAGTPLIGCSTAGEITTEGPDEGSVVIGVLGGVEARVGRGGDIRRDADQAGRRLGRDLADHAGSLVVLCTDGLTGNTAAAIAGLQAELGEGRTAIGGTAGDDFRFQRTHQFFRTETLTASAVGASLRGDFTFGAGVRHGWEPVGLPMRVTKSEGNRIVEINGQPAAKLYEDYFGDLVHRFHGEPLGRMAVAYPLGLAVPGSPEYLLRAPFSVDARGGIDCKAAIPEGAEVRLMIGNPSRAIQAARIAAMEAIAQLKGRLPRIALVFNCVPRRRLLGRLAAEEIEAIRDVLGRNVPLIGFYTYGEIAPLLGVAAEASSFHNETVVILALG